jgi:hypothetical protein
VKTLSEPRFEKLEKLIKEMEVERKYIINELNELHLAIEKLQQTTNNDRVHNSSQMQNSKVDYLTAANEQMFNQNQRLRQYIEDCLDGKKQLDEKGYLHALSGE